MAAFDPRYFGIPPSQQIQVENRYSYTASAGQTVFAARYTIGYVDVFLNGSHLEPSAFTAANGTSIVLNSAAGNGDSVVIVARPLIPINNTYTQNQVNNLVQNYYANTTSGTTDAIVATTTPTFLSWVDGMEVKVRMSSANATTTPTISFNGLTALTIVRDGQQPLTGNDWGPSQEVTLRYDITTNNLTLMSGKLTAITPAQFDNSSKYATTSFLRQAVGSLSGYAGTITANKTLTAADAGKWYSLEAPGLTITLPLASSVPSGTRFYLRKRSSSVATANIVHNSVTIRNVLATETNLMVFTSDGVSAYIMNDMPEGPLSLSLTNSGYHKFPSGLLLQWGSGLTNSSGQLAATLPIAFPNGWFGAVATCQQAASYVCAVNNLTTTAITVTMYASTSGATVGTGGSIVWYALGY
jgi:hypothetical protein